MNMIFTRLSGNLAVILVVATFIGGSDLIEKFTRSARRMRYTLIAGILGGLFGIYGNLSGVSLNGAIVSVRDIGPMLAGFIGGPLGGLIGGAIAGLHRYYLGGITAVACIIATCCIGTFCGLFSRKYREKLVRPLLALGIGAAMEVFHLGVVLLIVRPFSTALSIVTQIAIPFILVNAVGFSLMITIMSYIERQRLLMIEQSRLQSELEAASVIQHSLLPPITDTYPGRSEFSIAATMEAAKDVGGDFYDFFFLGTTKLVLLIADVSGKGIPAALFMANAKLTLQNCLRDIPDLAEAILVANDALCNNNEAEMFVTAWIGILDIATGGIDFVCAGHNPPILINETGAQYIRHRSGFVLAGMEGMRYRPQHIDLAPGDVLLLYTDGVTEAENKHRDQYGEKRLLDCISSIQNPDAQIVVDRVRSDIAAFVDGFDQFDDLTMLCLKLNESDRPRHPQ